MRCPNFNTYFISSDGHPEDDSWGKLNPAQAAEHEAGQWHAQNDARPNQFGQAGGYGSNQYDGGYGQPNNQYGQGYRQPSPYQQQGAYPPQNQFGQAGYGKNQQYGQYNQQYGGQPQGYNPYGGQPQGKGKKGKKGKNEGYGQPMQPPMQSPMQQPYGQGRLRTSFGMGTMGYRGECAPIYLVKVSN